jgi:hypothetical protein
MTINVISRLPGNPSAYFSYLRYLTRKIFRHFNLELKGVFDFTEFGMTSTEFKAAFNP